MMSLGSWLNFWQTPKNMSKISQIHHCRVGLFKASYFSFLIIYNHKTSFYVCSRCIWNSYVKFNVFCKGFPTKNLECICQALSEGTHFSSQSQKWVRYACSNIQYNRKNDLIGLIFAHNAYIKLYLVYVKFHVNRMIPS